LSIVFALIGSAFLYFLFSLTVKWSKEIEWKATLPQRTIYTTPIKTVEELEAATGNLCLHERAEPVVTLAGDVLDRAVCLHCLKVLPDSPGHCPDCIRTRVVRSAGWSYDYYGNDGLCLYHRRLSELAPCGCRVIAKYASGWMSVNEIRERTIPCGEHREHFRTIK
jgi:hypothetical protein